MGRYICKSLLPKNLGSSAALRNVAKRCESLQIVAKRCETLRNVAKRCESLRIVAFCFAACPVLSDRKPAGQTGLSARRRCCIGRLWPSSERQVPAGGLQRPLGGGHLAAAVGVDRLCGPQGNILAAYIRHTAVISHSLSLRLHT